MPQGQFNLGRDIGLTIFTPQAGPLTLNTIKSFKSKSDDNVQKIILINGITDHLRFFQGWSGSFDIERANAVLDQYFALLESNYFLGIPEAAASITETIQEVNGTVSQYRYPGVILSFSDAGDYTGDKSVSQSLSFVSRRRIQIV
jgi:hypothetical protein